MKNYAEDICALEENNFQFKPQAIGALVKLILLHANNYCNNQNLNPQIIEAGNTIFRQFRNLVEQKYAKWHDVSSYAKQLHITPDHLNRTVKELIGKTAKDFIQDRLVVAAKRELYFSGLSTKEIAYQLGFKETAHFSAFFKKRTGFSPTDFKKRV